jgi:alkaline phosphatase D
MDNASSRLEDLRQLALYADRIPDCETFLAEITLMNELSGESAVGGPPDEKLTLSTIHQSKGLEWDVVFILWLTEGRDFRSPNTMPDGPEKSIWGKKQKEWLKRTLLASDADWKVLVSPTPIVGPDRSTKADNLSNRAFAFEGDEMRRWFAGHLPDNFFIACGDRHWQYHSVDPATGVQEFSCGPASDKHAGGTPGKDPRYHRFHRVGGGFLSVHVDGTGISFHHHDVDGKVVYEYVKPLPK